MVTAFKKTSLRPATYNSDPCSQMHAAVLLDVFKTSDTQVLSKILKSGTDILI